mgnify:CR=1
NDKETEMGSLFHLFMSNIEYSNQINRVKNDFFLDESISKNHVMKIFNMAKKVINKSDLKPFFTKNYEITCEKE